MHQRPVLTAKGVIITGMIIILFTVSFPRHIYSNLSVPSAEQMTPATLPGFDEDCSTILAGNMEDNFIV